MPVDYGAINAHPAEMKANAKPAFYQSWIQIFRVSSIWPSPWTCFLPFPHPPSFQGSVTTICCNVQWDEQQVQLVERTSEAQNLAKEREKVAAKFAKADSYAQQFKAEKDQLQQRVKVSTSAGCCRYSLGCVTRLSLCSVCLHCISVMLSLAGANACFVCWLQDLEAQLASCLAQAAAVGGQGGQDRGPEQKAPTDAEMEDGEHPSAAQPAASPAPSQQAATPATAPAPAGTPGAGITPAAKRRAVHTPGSTTPHAVPASAPTLTPASGAAAQPTPRARLGTGMKRGGAQTPAGRGTGPRQQSRLAAASTPGTTPVARPPAVVPAKAAAAAAVQAAATPVTSAAAAPATSADITPVAPASGAAATPASSAAPIPPTFETPQQPGAASAVASTSSAAVSPQVVGTSATPAAVTPATFAAVTPVAATAVSEPAIPPTVSAAGDTTLAVSAPAQTPAGTPVVPTHAATPATTSTTPGQEPSFSTPMVGQVPPSIPGSVTQQGQSEAGTPLPAATPSDAQASQAGETPGRFDTPSQYMAIDVAPTPQTTPAPAASGAVATTTPLSVSGAQVETPSSAVTAAAASTPASTPMFGQLFGYPSGNLAGDQTPAPSTEPQQPTPPGGSMQMLDAPAQAPVSPQVLADVAAQQPATVQAATTPMPVHYAGTPATSAPAMEQASVLSVAAAPFVSSQHTPQQTPVPTSTAQMFTPQSQQAGDFSATPGTLQAPANTPASLAATPAASTAAGMSQEGGTAAPEQPLLTPGTTPLFTPLQAQQAQSGAFGTPIMPASAAAAAALGRFGPEGGQTPSMGMFGTPTSFDGMFTPGNSQQAVALIYSYVGF